MRSRQLGKEFGIFPKGSEKALKGFKEGNDIDEFAFSGCSVEIGLGGKAVDEMWGDNMKVMVYGGVNEDSATNRQPSIAKR